ncbi:MAG: insulinase family protein [Chlorobi bacterium]|nr:insulinase family protein [Chlorobiota bacterium]
MIHFNRFTLDNGLRVLVNSDDATPLVAFNLLYQVGAKHENPERTGFAHLFEHLMFGGSKNAKNFDTPIQMAGGESNAFTNNDFTNYYVILPKANIETAFWLESDRMLELDFSPKTLEVQRQVVIEEYKQRYLNQPYGDVWLLLRPLTYKVHPYRWATIGKEIRHIEKATLEEVKQFFYHHYAPNNAILTLSGNITPGEAEKLSRKWFGEIPARQVDRRDIPVEPAQKEPATLSVRRPVPVNAIYLAYHIGDRLSGDYYCADLISDLLAGGPSSRLYQHLVKEKQLFSQIDAYITGSVDPGLFVISGNLNPGISMERAEAAIYNELYPLIQDRLDNDEVTAMKNKAESAWMYAQMHILNRAMNLAFFEMLGDPERINTELESFRRVERNDITRCAQTMFSENNRSILYYYKESD